MRRIVCLLVALVVCASLVIPTFAAEGAFVPSITYKDGPADPQVVINGENATGCVIVTSLKEAKEKTTDIYQEDRDLLLDVYDQLQNGTMELPLASDYVIRELVDVSFVKTGCVEVPHGHKEWLAEKGNQITLTFDLDIKKGTEVIVLVYVDEKWVPAESVQNNVDGTVTCVFEDICPVAFCVESVVEQEPPKTGDAVGEDLMLWIGVMAVSFVVMIVVVLNRRKFIR